MEGAGGFATWDSLNAKAKVTIDSNLLVTVSSLSIDIGAIELTGYDLLTGNINATKTRFQSNDLIISENKQLTVSRLYIFLYHFNLLIVCD